MTTVFRLPEEPPVTTTVESVAEPKRRYTRSEHGWSGLRYKSGHIWIGAGWPLLLAQHPEGLVVVEPDPHPTPWAVDDGVAIIVVDADGDVVCEMLNHSPVQLVIAQRIVDAVNKAAET